MPVYIHTLKTSDFRFCGNRRFSACRCAAPNPANHKICDLERRINPAAARFCKSLCNGQLIVVPLLFLYSRPVFLGTRHN